LRVQRNEPRKNPRGFTWQGGKMDQKYGIYIESVAVKFTIIMPWVCVRDFATAFTKEFGSTIQHHRKNGETTVSVLVPGEQAWKLQRLLSHFASERSIIFQPVLEHPKVVINS